MAGVAFAVEGDGVGVGFATESYAASALYTTLASLSGALWRIRRARGVSQSWRETITPSPRALSRLQAPRRPRTHLAMAGSRCHRCSEAGHKFFALRRYPSCRQQRHRVLDLQVSSFLWYAWFISFHQTKGPS